MEDESPYVIAQRFLENGYRLVNPDLAIARQARRRQRRTYPRTTQMEGDARQLREYCRAMLMQQQAMDNLSAEERELYD